ncbi:substrate-binding periplasmic protein [Chitinimonas sp.]|uniref:substrate-binding periplasmic protein n=1 Tax=Chitinimonas sp. TaxID=1934313 RepID=UPI002F91CF31
MFTRTAMRRALGLLLLALPPYGQAEDYTLYTTTFSRLVAPDGEGAKGLYVEIMQRVEQETGHHFRWVFQPWPRAQLSAQGDPAGLVVNLTRSPEREAKYRWVSPMGWGRYGIFTLRDQPLTADKPIGYLHGSDVLNVLQAAGYGNLTAGLSADSNARKLQARRIGGWAVNIWTGPTTYEEAGYDIAELRVQPIGEAWDQWIAASPQFPQPVALQIAAVLRKLKADGTLKMLEAKYWRPLPGYPTPSEARGH